MAVISVDIGPLLLVLGTVAVFCGGCWLVHRAIPVGGDLPPEPRAGAYEIHLRLDHADETGPIQTAAAAHLAMQLHRGCDIDWCARKAAAHRWLVEHGRMRIDSGRAWAAPR